MKRIVLLGLLIAAPVLSAQINVPNVAPADALSRLAARCTSRGFTIQEMTSTTVACSRPANTGSNFVAALALGGTGGQGFDQVVRFIAFGSAEMSYIQYTATIEGQGPYGKKKSMLLSTSGKGGLDESMRDVFPEWNSAPAPAAKTEPSNEQPVPPKAVGPQ